MDKFLKEYDGHLFSDDGPKCSSDFKSFARKFKNYLGRTLPDGCSIKGHGCGHYDFSGFVEREGKYVYYSWSWDRYSRVDVKDGLTMSNSLLYRTAEGPKDYRGGRNRLCSLKDAPGKLFELLALQGGKEER